MKKKFIIVLTAVLVLGVSAIVLYPKLFPSKAVSYWTDPMMPGFKSPTPGKSPMGMEMVPVYEDEGHSKAGEQPAQEEYYCPMHPDMKSDKPGNCPVCSMKLVKLEKAKGKPVGMASETAAGSSIFIDPQRQQLIGVRTAVAQMKPLAKEIRAVGKVAYDETGVTHIHTKVSGYIEDVFVDYIGKAVQKGDPLFTLYSPELVATQEEYLLALRSQAYAANSPLNDGSQGSNTLVESARRRLRLFDITDEEIDQLAKEGKPKRALSIYSPVSGVVTERAAYQHGTRVNPEMDLYTIVNLANVWVISQVYEYELPYVKMGQIAEIEFPYSTDTKSLRGRVSFIYPFFSSKTRTAQLRMEFANPNFILKPDMFFNVKIKVNLGRKLVVPEDAVMNTGTEQYVFVDKGDGYFEPRLVKIGAEADGQYAIESGLKDGERVVTAANFILDSESRLKGAFANMGRPGENKMEKPTSAASSLKVEIQEPKVAKVGKNDLRLTVRDASGNPVTDADVEVTLFMPQMGNMAPMTAKAYLSHAGNGEYKGMIDIPMAWTWQTTITVKKAGKTLGSVQTNFTAR